MGKNEIFIHTDKGSYVGGDVIYGTVFVSIEDPIASKGMIMEIKGYEKVMWQYLHTETYTEGEETKTRTEVREHKDDKTFFKNEFRLIDYPGGFPVGKFSYPFQYTLPSTLPGCFWKQKKNGLKMKAKIQYKIKCIIDIPGTSHDLKVKQHLIIHEKLDKMIEAKHHNKMIQVKLCCCIPRGPVRCECWMDKNAYMGGETAQVQVKVENDSKSNVNYFVSRLIREIKLEAKGVKHTIREIVCQQKYEGTPSLSKKETGCPLPLVTKKGKPMKPSTSSKLVHCSYQMFVGLDIPWAPDLEIFSPVTIYAPQSQVWSQWTPPLWLSQAQVQNVCSDLLVPQNIQQNLTTNALNPNPQQPQNNNGSGTGLMTL